MNLGDKIIIRAKICDWMPHIRNVTAQTDQLSQEATEENKTEEEVFERKKRNWKIGLTEQLEDSHQSLQGN